MDANITDKKTLEQQIAQNRQRVMAWWEKIYDKKDATINELCAPLEYVNDISYSPNGKGLYKVLNNFLTYFFGDISHLINKGKNTKIPKKFWGLFYFFMKRAYPPNGSNYKQEIVYVLSRQPDLFNSKNEFAMQRSIENLSNDIRKYCKNCVKSSEQELFTIKGTNEAITVNSMSWRIFITEFVFKHHDELNSYKEFMNCMSLTAFDIASFKEYVNDPDNDNKPANNIETAKLISIWEKVKEEAEELLNSSDVVKSDYFHEKEFEEILESALHANELHKFYEKTVGDYISILEKLQAIIDMKYISMLYSKDRDSTSDDIYQNSLQQIADVVQKEFEHVFCEFMKMYNAEKNRKINQSDPLFKQLSEAITLESANQVIMNNHYLFDKIAEKSDLDISKVNEVSPILEKLKYHYNK